jgi:tetratricopeptide (TPR) repeat protein
MKIKTVILSFVSIIIIAAAIFLLNQVNVINNGSEEVKYVTDGDITYLNTALDVKYVGTESCVDCHEEIYNVYIESQTGRSMSRMSSSNIIEEFPQKEAVYDTSRNFYYEMIRRDDRFYQREYRLDDVGNIVHERVEEAQYIIGSGKDLRMYFYQDNGMYYQLPLTWYTHENMWDMSPGYSEFNNVRFSRYVSPMCFSCHNGHMELSSTANNRYNGKIHLGIGCESCHGPGDLHVRQEYKEDINLPFENSVTIVNPPKLSPQRRIDVCQQCHLEGQAWALNGDNTWFDFRPGMLLKTHRSVYSPSDVKKETFRVANSAYRLSLSRCFDGSHSTMSCDLCHDPHRMNITMTVEYNRKNCQKCHPPQSLPGEKSRFAHSKTNDCIPCHMKRTGTDNTLHGVINTDHWIRVNADDDTINWKSLREISKDNPVTYLIADINNEDEDSYTRKGMAYFEFWKDKSIITSYLDSASHYLTMGLKISASNATGYYFLGKVQYFRKEFSSAVLALKKSIGLRPEDADSYFYLGQSYAELNNLNLAIINFRKANELLPDEPEYLEKLGITLAKNDSTEEAITTLEKALTKDKQNPYVYYTLGNLYAQSKNNPSKALPYFEKAVILDPDIPDGLLNLGNTYVLLAKFDQAIISYKKAQLFNPQSSNVLVNIGRVYSHLGQIKEARDAFNQALRISPGLDIARQLLNDLPDL